MHNAPTLTVSTIWFHRVTCHPSSALALPLRYVDLETQCHYMVDLFLPSLHGDDVQKYVEITYEVTHHPRATATRFAPENAAPCHWQTQHQHAAIHEKKLAIA